MNAFLAKRISGGGVKADHRATLIAAARSMDGVISMGRGDPDMPTPPHIVAAGKRALDDGYFGYSPWIGFPDLREALAEKLRRKNGIPARPEEIIVTCGAQEAVVIALMAILNPGDEILMPDPRYTPYDAVAELAGGTVVPVPTRLEDGFQVRIDELERLVTPRTKALLIISPNNPTGQVMDRERSAEIAAFAVRRNLVVVSDQLYEEALEEGVDNPTLATFPGMAERTITINGFSKTYNMTGWRVGYLHAPADIVKAMLPLKYALTISAPSVSQRAALAALAGPQGCVAEMNAIYRARRAIVRGALDRIGMRYCPPRGAFYVFAELPPELPMTAFAFCMRFLEEEKVLVFPGTAFGETAERFIRISLLAPDERIVEGMERMERFIRRSLS